MADRLAGELADEQRRQADLRARMDEHRRNVKALQSELNHWWVRAGRTDLSEVERRQAAEKAWQLGVQLARVHSGWHDPKAPLQQG